MSNKIKELKKLKSEIKDGWFFDDYFKCHPKNKKAGGFLGIGKYFLIFPNPNKRNGDINVSNWALDKFFRLSIDLDIKNAHLTDFIKIPLTKNEAIKYWADRNKFCLNLQYLEKEIKIINPSKIIIVGRSYFDKIKPIIEPIAKEKAKIDWIYHYACYESNKWEKIENQLKRIKAI